MAFDTAAVGLSHSLTNSINNLNQQIGTGSRLNEAKNDPSGIQVSIEMTGQIRGNNVAIRNSNDGISALQVAEGGVSNISDSLERLRELTVQASNGTLNDDDRSALQDEASALLGGIRDTIGSSEFNGRSLLNNEDGINIQNGADPGQTQSVRSMDLEQRFEDANLFNLDLTNPDTEDAFESIDSALSLAGELRSEFGASQNRLEFGIDSLLSSNEAETASRSRIEDTDMAKAVSEMAQADVQRKVEIAMLGQANASKGQILSLLNF